MSTPTHLWCGEHKLWCGDKIHPLNMPSNVFMENIEATLKIPHRFKETWCSKSTCMFRKANVTNKEEPALMLENEESVILLLTSLSSTATSRRLFTSPAKALWVSVEFPHAPEICLLTGWKQCTNTEFSNIKPCFLRSQFTSDWR